MCRRSVFWKGLSTWVATPKLKSGAPNRDPDQESLSGLFDQHTTAHFHVQRMAEPVAVVPVHTGLAGRKGNRRCLLRADFHANTVVYHTEAVGYVFDGIQVGHIHRNLITFLDLELSHTIHGRNRRHVNTHLVAVTDNLIIGLQGNAILLSLGTATGKERIITIIDFLGLDLIAAYQDTVVRLGKGRAVVHQLHFLTGNVDQLVVLRVQRANWQEAVLGELGQYHQPLAIRITRFRQRRMVVARLVMHIQLLANVIHLLAVVVLDGIRNVPLTHLTVDKQCCVSVATTVEGGVQGPKTQLWLRHNGVTQLNFIVKQIVELIDSDNRSRRRQLAVGNEVLTIRGGVQTVRVLRNRNVTGELGLTTTINNRNFGVANCLELTGFNSGRNALDVEHNHPVAVVAHSTRQIQRTLGVVTGRSSVLAGVVSVGVVQVAVYQHLPGYFHSFRINRAEHGVAVFQAVFTAIVRLWNHKLGVAENIVCARHFLQTQTVDCLNVWHVRNLIRLHDIQTNTRYTSVGLVVDEQVLAIITAVFHGDVRVVAVAVQVLLVAAENLFTLVGNTPTSSRIHVEYRNPHQFAHGRHAQNTYFTLVTTAPETVVFVQFAGLDVNLVLGFLDGSGKRFTGHDGCAKTGCTGYACERCCAHKATAAQATFRRLRRILGQIISFFHSIQLRYWLWRLSPPSAFLRR